MKLIKLFLSLIIIIASVILCHQIISNSIPNQKNKIDYAELNYVKYGLLSVEEWKVVKFVDPKNTMRQIASTNRLSELDIRRIVYGLLQAGLVELARPVGAVAATPLNPKQFPVQDKLEQKTLINKLIGRIRTM